MSTKPSIETDRGTTTVHGGLPLFMTAVYHSDFQGGDPYDIPPTEWTFQIQFTDIRYDRRARRITRSGSVAGGLQSLGENELEVLFEHTYGNGETDAPRLVWYRHRIARFGVERYGYLVLDPRDQVLDAMEWDFLARDPGDALTRFEQVESFLNQPTVDVPHARLLFHLRPTQ